MSILKKLIATAGVFALASASLVSAPVSAATVSTSAGSLPSSVRLCAQDTSASGTSRTDITNGATLTATVNGTAYNLYTTNLNNCTGATTTDYTLVTGGPVYALLNHDTTLTFGGTASPFSVTSTYNNASPKYNGDTTFNICQGDSRSFDILVTDADNDVLNGSASASADAFITVSYPANGQVNYRVEPKPAFYNTQNTVAANITLTTVQAAVTPTTVFGTNSVATVLNLRTVSCPNGIPATASSSSKSSSSVSSMSSSSMSSSSATPVASTVAASSAVAPKPVADAPMADSAKGSTVRTGGAN
jgi:hypothetical protein